MNRISRTLNPPGYVPGWRLPLPETASKAGGSFRLRIRNDEPAEEKKAVRGSKGHCLTPGSGDHIIDNHLPDS